MTRWQRIVRYLLAAFVLVFSLVVYLALRERPASQSGTGAGRSDPEALAESIGGVAQLAKAARQDLQIEYGRLLLYPDGRSRFLDGIKVNVPERSGRGFTLTAREGEAREDQTTVHVDGDVKMTTTDGLTAAAQKATYESADTVVRVPGRLDFTRNRMTGSSNGATFDRTRDVLWLLADAKIDVAPDPSGGGALTMRAGSAGFARRERYLRFDRDVRITQAGEVVEADNAMTYLHAEQDVLTMAELRGNSRVVRETTGAGQLRSMTSRDMNLHYREDGRTLERVTLAGTAAVQFAGTDGQAGRRLSAEWLDVTLEPDGSPAIIAARDNVELTLPASGATPARRIRSVSLEAAGEPGQGITTARFLDRVEFVESRAAQGSTPAGERRVRSRTLDAVVTPGFGGIEGAVFGGGVQLSDAGLEASAPDATYNVAKGTMQLVAGQGGAGAQVSDARATIEARTIDVTLEGQSLVADRDVRSVLKSSPRGAKDAGGVRRPGMLKADQPVNVAAAHLVYDSASGRATYSGDARLWQGETAVQARTIVLDDKLGNLEAAGGVRSSWRLVDTDPKTKTSKTQTTVATAEDLLYEDEPRRATYTTNARMNGPEGDLRARKIELYLDETGDRLSRVEAYDEVSLHSESRLSTGARLSYFAADERYVMSGPEVRVLEQLTQECRETLGKTLTFYRAIDTIAVDGNDQRRTQTTTGGKCPEPQAK